jgi:hypothetical protein
MVKLVLMFKYAQDRPIEESERHYLTFHTTEAIKFFRELPGFVKYVQNRVVRHVEFRNNTQPGVEVPPAFDRSIEVFFTDAESMNNCVQHPRMRELWDDHPNFMDCGPLTQDSYELEEVVPAFRSADGSFYERARPDQA